MNLSSNTSAILLTLLLSALGGSKRVLFRPLPRSTGITKIQIYKKGWELYKIGGFSLCQMVPLLHYKKC